MGGNVWNQLRHPAMVEGTPIYVPILSRCIWDVFSVPISTVSSKSVFSSCGRLKEWWIMSLKLDLVEMINFKKVGLSRTTDVGGGSYSKVFTIIFWQFLYKRPTRTIWIVKCYKIRTKMIVKLFYSFQLLFSNLFHIFFLILFFLFLI